MKQIYQAGFYFLCMLEFYVDADISFLKFKYIYLVLQSVLSFNVYAHN